MTPLDKNQVILVNERDEQIGTSDKMEAHQKGLLHRAVSVFIFTSKGEWVLQQRAKDKYHSGGLWSNTACTHPFVGESNLDSAARRLQEEMGMQTELKYILSFQYQVELDNNLIEHELDHIFVGTSDLSPQPNVAEVHSYRTISTEELRSELNRTPELFTEWFKMLFDQVIPHVSR